METAVRLLHVTDTHILVAGGDHNPDDLKVNLQFPAQSRAEVLDRLFRRVAETLKQKKECLDGVIFSGDALFRGSIGGSSELLGLIKNHFNLDPSRILSVPGNHDVVRGSPPSSLDRYQDFVATWREAGCITPWLDGIDEGTFNILNHVLMPKDHSWAVVAINSCNWSHVDSVVPKGLQEVWEQIPLAVARGDPGVEEKVRESLRGLIQHDAAHISSRQFEIIREIYRSLPQPEHGPQLRMIALHHHLRDPSHRLEVKSMANLLPLETLRTMLAELDIKVVFHGHKHSWRQHFDYVDREEQGSAEPHRVLILSGGTFSDQNDSAAASVVHIDNLPWAPSAKINLLVPQPGGLDLKLLPSNPIPIWEYADKAPALPTATVQGADLDEVYAKILAHCSDSKAAPLLVQLDLPPEAPDWQLPASYSDLTPEQKRGDWLENLVKWWQRSDSLLEKRVPYIHGVRLQRYDANIDQIANIIDLLKDKGTSRAVAVLLDPRRDFETKDTKFASFCLVQFVRRKEAQGKDALDVIGYYRAQEMRQWWPINVGELRYLQRTVIQGGVPASPGRITTFTAEARVDTAPRPTHVATPLIDRWLDQSPEKFFILATCMLSARVENEQEQQVAAEWMDELRTLKTSLLREVGDGGPVVAIDGLERLALFLEAGGTRAQGACTELAEHLRELATNSAIAPENGGTKLQTWQKSAGKKLESVTALSAQLLQQSCTTKNRLAGD